MTPPNIKAPKFFLFFKVKGKKGILPWLITSIVGGSLLRRAHFQSLRAAEAKNTATMKGTKVHNPRAILSLLKFVSSA